MKKIEKILGIFMLFLVLILANLLFFVSYKMSITGSSVLERYSYTKAICENNICQDYEIACQNNQLLYKQPITEKIKFSEDWKDPRIKEEIDKLC